MFFKVKGRTEQRKRHETILRLTSELDGLLRALAEARNCDSPHQRNTHDANLLKAKNLDLQISALKRSWDVQDATNKTQIAFVAALLALVTLGFNVIKGGMNRAAPGPEVRVVVIDGKEGRAR